MSDEDFRLVSDPWGIRGKSIEVFRLKPDGAFWINEDATAEQLRAALRQALKTIHDLRND